jgi:hypothetical protein
MAVLLGERCNRLAFVNSVSLWSSQGLHAAVGLSGKRVLSVACQKHATLYVLTVTSEICLARVWPDKTHLISNRVVCV